MPEKALVKPFGRLTPEESHRLFDVVLELSHAHDLPTVMAVVRRAARDLTRADGVTFVLREGDLVHYADENAIQRLWKGQRFPANACISGWAIHHRTSVVIEDVFADERIPHDLYRPTFVRSLAMVPIRVEDPLGAIGAYWASTHRATPDEVATLEALAGTAAVAMENAELYTRLQDAVRARDEFLRVAAHELRTPLTPLKMHVQALRRSLTAEADPERVEHGLERVAAQVARLERLAEHLLDDTTLAHGGLLLDCEEVDLREVARASADRLRPSFEHAGRPLEVRADVSIVGTWDRLRLERLVDNLLSNALRHGVSGPVEVDVAEEEDDRARLTVRDHGPGLAPENRARVFERFERATSSEHFGGFGLGLWIVKQTVEAHRGEVLVEDAPGRGTAFRVLLPRRR